MTEELYFPQPLKHLYKRIDNGEEVVLLYKNIQAFDHRKDAEYMIDSVLYMGDDEIPVCYPISLWVEEFEIVPVSIELFDEVDEA